MTMDTDPTWLESAAKLIEPLAPPTPAECRGTVNMARFARALEDMVEFGDDPALIERAIGWHGRDDFETLLNDWEARHPAARHHA
jgi:hypothetical protein